ncbi:MAG: hypothetical protein JNG83_02250 [Opitutaceae bacterium]|nr:hypothetical protein [Opitutaceae bacterium]
MLCRPQNRRARAARAGRGFRLALLAGLLATRLRAGDTTASDDDLRIRGVFDSALPGTERKHALKLIVHPHLGDLTESDFLRTALGLRYGLTQRWEATGEVETYFAHGLKQKRFFDEAGLAGWHLGTKYRLGDPLRLGVETSVGVDWLQPTGTPPVEVTDGLRHVTPFVAFSRQLERHPAWRVFVGASYDDVAATDVAGRLTKNELGGDAVSLSGGFLYERGPLTYTLEASYATMHPTDDVGREVFTLRPGIIWVVPAKYTFGSEGKWLVGFGLRAAHGPDGYDFGANAKLRVNFDFKRLLGRRKKSAWGR